VALTEERRCKVTIASSRECRAVSSFNFKKKREGKMLKKLVLSGMRHGEESENLRTFNERRRIGCFATKHQVLLIHKSQRARDIVNITRINNPARSFAHF